VRFQRGLPRKMLGYRAISKFLTDIVRSLSEYTQGALTYIHGGSASRVERLFTDPAGNTSIISNRTPAALVANIANIWQFDISFQSGGVNINQLLAHVAPNLSSIGNSVGGQLFFGDATTDTLLAQIDLTGLGAGANISGGVVVLHPYTLVFGSNGYVAWNVPGEPTDFVGIGSGAANVAAQKIVCGRPMRGGPGSSPSGLLWSLDAVIRVSFTGGASVFTFDTIAGQSSIMSSQSVIEYDGVFYWIGTDRFLSFNGVIREIPNNMSTDWFFDGLNYEQRQKVFAYKVPRFGEIWWCYPRGSATEPTHAIIYNIREGTWYDTELPNGGRSAGITPAVFQRPLMAGVLPNADSQYKLWVHESGFDEIDGTSVRPILSFFETADISIPVQQQTNKALRVSLMEPDFVQRGPLEMSLHGRANARAPEVDGASLTIPEIPTTPAEQVLYLKDERRQMRFRFTSNAVGGYYEMGHVMAHVEPAGGTVIG